MPVTKQQPPESPVEVTAGRPKNYTHLEMRSWTRLENREHNQLDDELDEDKDILCVPFFRLRLSPFRIIGLSLLLLVIGRCGVICKRFETEGDADLIGLFEAYAFFHGDVMGLTSVSYTRHCD
jgi:hypothetical protein